jgi:hypothetical protein
MSKGEVVCLPRCKTPQGRNGYGHSNGNTFIITLNGYILWYNISQHSLKLRLNRTLCAQVIHGVNKSQPCLQLDIVVQLHNFVTMQKEHCITFKCHNLSSVHQ